jgi:hypothetical protein
MHFTIAIIIPIIIAGIINKPIPKGINAIITTNPIIAPIIVNKTLNNTTPILSAATIKTKNITKPNNISILHLPFI